MPFHFLALKSGHFFAHVLNILFKQSMWYLNRSQFGHVTHFSFSSHLYSHPFVNFFKVWPLSPRILKCTLMNLGLLVKSLSSGTKRFFCWIIHCFFLPKLWTTFNTDLGVNFRGKVLIIDLSRGNIVCSSFFFRCLRFFGGWCWLELLLFNLIIYCPINFGWRHDHQRMTKTCNFCFEFHHLSFNCTFLC